VAPAFSTHSRKENDDDDDDDDDGDDGDDGDDMIWAFRNEKGEKATKRKLYIIPALTELCHDQGVKRQGSICWWLTASYPRCLLSVNRNTTSEEESHDAYHCSG